MPRPIAFALAHPDLALTALLVLGMAAGAAYGRWWH